MDDSTTKMPPALEPAFLTIPAARSYLGLGQSSIYRLMGAGQLEARKHGGRTLITFASAKAYAASLPPAKISPPPERKRLSA